jgi:hypothetical protein
MLARERKLSAASAADHITATAALSSSLCKLASCSSVFVAGAHTRLTIVLRSDARVQRVGRVQLLLLLVLLLLLSKCTHQAA